MAGNEGADDHLCPGPTSWRHSAGRGHDRGPGRGVTPALTLGGILPCKGLLRIESGPVLRGAIGALGGRTTGGHADGAGLGGLCGGLRPSPATARVLARSWCDPWTTRRCWHICSEAGCCRDPATSPVLHPGGSGTDRPGSGDGGRDGRRWPYMVALFVEEATAAHAERLASRSQGASRGPGTRCLAVRGRGLADGR